MSTPMVAHDEPFDVDPESGSDTTFSVGELTAAINGVLREGFPGGVWVRGEVKGLSERGPHVYFDLAEEGPDGSAKLSIKFFAPARQRMRPRLERAGLRLANGLKVRIHGRLDVYAANGGLGLILDDIDSRFTMGELALEREALVRRLKESGLYDRNKALELSVPPLRVGVVTSTASAAWADFRHEIEGSGLAFLLRVVDVRVQGDTAPAEVSRAVTFLGAQTDLDAVVVVRGGGARTDLAAFDHESVAVAIARCGLPVFVGVGHEIDHSIADEVAHTAVKTPTACARALVDHVLQFVDLTEQAWAHVASAATLRLMGAEAQVAQVGSSIRHRVVAAVERSDAHLQRHQQRLHEASLRAVHTADQRVDRAVVELRRAPGRIEQHERRLDDLARQMRLLDPVTIMARGWSITRTPDGRTVRSIAELHAGDAVLTTFADGTARSIVDQIDPTPSPPVKEPS